MRSEPSSCPGLVTHQGQRCEWVRDPPDHWLVRCFAWLPWDLPALSPLRLHPERVLVAPLPCFDQPADCFSVDPVQGQLHVGFVPWSLLAAPVDALLVCFAVCWTVCPACLVVCLVACFAVFSTVVPAVCPTACPAECLVAWPLEWAVV